MPIISPPLQIIEHIFIFLAGISLGSFLNVVVYRLPRGLSLVTPRSHCPNCKTTIRGYDNIPLASYLWLGGTCRRCGFPISCRYFFLELATGLLLLAFYHFRYPFAIYAAIFGSPFNTAAFASWLTGAAFLAVLLVIAVIDIQLYLIPDILSIGGTFLCLAAGPLTGRTTFGDSLLAAAIGFGFYYGLWLLTAKRGVGLGDAKLMAMIGAFLGTRALLPVVFIASFTGSVIGIGLMVFTDKTRKSPVPFGPFLALGAAAYLFFQKPVSNLFALFF